MQSVSCKKWLIAFYNLSRKKDLSTSSCKCVWTTINEMLKPVSTVKRTTSRYQWDFFFYKSFITTWVWCTTSHFRKKSLNDSLHDTDDIFCHISSRCHKVMRLTKAKYSDVSTELWMVALRQNSTGHRSLYRHYGFLDSIRHRRKRGVWINLYNKLHWSCTL